MHAEYEALPLVNNTAQHRFELVIDGHTAFILYRHVPGKTTLIHTEVPEALEGRGAGNAIVEKTLHYIEEQGDKLVPLCPFVLAYIKRHPEWKRIVHDDVKI
ncbi:N-acetyltransferase [Chitinophaga lutea]|uniref:N-acetyltransferase n=1 Tax=Chitinophaga lutea TaxID=2488634 RepID=A0A3N4PKQ0_9BACT|nr:GNAT family N-acetyltransferase [Chitinophaga lutea]RPE09262.1 N-acetyltransferase [Chitinophaga lutea]